MAPGEGGGGTTVITDTQSIKDVLVNLLFAVEKMLSHLHTKLW